MGDRIDDVEERVRAVEAKMDQVPVTIEQRFDGVDAALLEQRQYTEFAFDKLERNMNARFDATDARFDAADARFDEIDAKFERIDGKFAVIDAKFDGINAKFDGIDAKFAEVKAEVRVVNSGLARLERKLDQFIDRHLPPPRSDTPEQPG